MTHFSTLLLCLSLSLPLFGQRSRHDAPPDEETPSLDDLKKEAGMTDLDLDKKAFQWYNKKGKRTSYKKLLEEARKADIVFFGELHNNPVCHWLQFELTRDLYAKVGDRLVMGAEMFESDNQLVINEYFLGVINKSSFEKEVRLWPNYKTDYEMLLEFARKNGLRWVATNTPRRYASLVFREGFDRLKTIPDYSRAFIAPLPIDEDLDLPCYKKMLEMGGGNANFPRAQMLKDATMAYFILRNWNTGELFLHYNGSFHSDNHEGIVWYLRRKNPDLKILVISTVEQIEIDELDWENKGKGDYILCIPERMTKTH
jgi:uncharacterized iron-regulated protein